MPQVPIAKREVEAQLTPTPYIEAKVNADTSGANVARAYEGLGGQIGKMGYGLLHLKEKYDRTKMYEFANEIADLEHRKVRIKEEGILYKTGKDFMGQSQQFMQDWDADAKKIREKYKFMGDYARRADAYLSERSRAVQTIAEKHDFDESEKWNAAVYQDTLANVYRDANFYRNDPEGLKRSMANLKATFNVMPSLQKLDPEMRAIAEKQMISQFHEAVLDGKSADNSLSAKEYFEAHKGEISYQKQAAYLDRVNNLGNKYFADEMANQLMMLEPSEAYKQINSIENLDTRDAVERRYNHYLNMQEAQKREAEKQMLDGFYNTALQKTQNGQALSYDDIPQGLDSKTQLSLMEYVSKNGAPDTQDDIWEELYELKVNNAQEFANLDLNKYRGYLSDSEYKQFFKDQKKIKDGKYYTDIKDDDKKINEALKSMGLDTDRLLPFRGDNRKIAYSEIRSLVREFEARKGRSIDNDELNSIINSLGYKGEGGVKIYKQLELGMRTRTGFIRDVIGDFIEYQNQHNGQMPSNEEKYKIINNRVANYEIEQNQKVINAIDNFNKTQQENQNDIFFGHSITSEYGKRNQPKKGASTYHKGIDLSYKMNEPVKAFEGGVVLRTGKSETLGNFIEIQDKNGVVHSYGHNNKITAKQGQHIKRGDEIALAGSTGVSTGPHVHYSKKQSGNYLNPTNQGGLIQDGTVIKNAKTGQRMVMRNGQWQLI